jgi:hypothetical protein
MILFADDPNRTGDLLITKQNGQIKFTYKSTTCDALLVEKRPETA